MTGDQRLEGVADLIARLEKATGPSAELDLEITRAVHSHDCQFQFYTASIDAALTLVPDDHIVDVLRWRNKTGHAEVRRDITGVGEIGNAPTPAIALCIAALKARAQG